MKIDVKHTAELSRIALTQEELDKFTPQMDTIIDSVKVFDDIDTTGVQPMKARVMFDELREDTPKVSFTQEEAIRNAKHKENGFVKVYGKVFGLDE